MLLFPDLWQYMNLNCDCYLTTTPVWLETKGIFQNVAYGTNQATFTRINRFILDWLYDLDKYSKKSWNVLGFF